MCARPSTNRKKEDTVLMAIYHPLSYYCFFLTQDKWDGEELIQETLSKAFVNYGAPNTWNVSLLKKIAYHTWIDQKRKKREETEQLVEQGYELNSNYEEVEALAEQLLSKMTVKQLVVFLLKDVFQYQITEIAENCGMTEMAVKAMLSRARNHLDNREDIDSSDQLPLLEEPADQLISVVIQVIQANDPTQLIQLIPEWFRGDQPTLRLYHSTHRPSSYALLMTA
ncbi:sigma factor-like helix-turn-helix DNA-binding protein [Gracilibacillus alcaliphilus]|uniref:sigma factor-like helix-turn-helix DNA-binding protein n=1 Tax=Gracilibacillus alcaliphilus TaxID=1401441 RepID=UPI00195F05FF|nr:sigma factor-like helix-turn-helix DNA-binding protein [Gracilibacillus alcaliphilus]MBM7678082.1 RNA polymerase sigma-70 factor (ECF subfamily) [Gracilibacillus alcaliphilus]